MNKISSKDIVQKKKLEFYLHILPKIKEKQRRLKKDILDFANNILVMPGEKGLKIGPVFGDFDPLKSHNSSYKEIIENLALAVNPYRFTTSRPDLKTQDLQEISLARNEVELDVSFENKINFIFEPDSIMHPVGFKAKIKDVNLIGNIKVPWQVDQILDDKLKAVESVNVLTEYGFDNYYLTKIFSAGNLGEDKKFVTTKQSITAIDDIIAKKLLKDIREFESIDSYLVFENEFLHNKIVVVLGKGNWEYEQFELWPQDSQWYGFGYNYEREGFRGRTTYAEKQAGGYYAARLAVVEYLHKIKKQARVLFIREIYDDYFIPVGVWQVRENVRVAMKKQPKSFDDKQQLLHYIKSRLKYNLNKYINESLLFRQSRLNEFFKSLQRD